MGGGLYIESNAALTNVDGLASLITISGNLHIESNAALCEASVLALAAGWTVSGSQQISNNRGTCP